MLPHCHCSLRVINKRTGSTVLCLQQVRRVFCPVVNAVPVLIVAIIIGFMTTAIILLI